jgi:hypothetical protein
MPLELPLHDLGLPIRQSGTCHFSGCAWGPIYEATMMLSLKNAESLIYLTTPGPAKADHPQGLNRLVDLSMRVGLNLSSIPSVTWQFRTRPDVDDEPTTEGPAMVMHQNLDDPQSMIPSLLQLCERTVEDMEQRFGVKVR